MIPTAWEHHNEEADVYLYPTICRTNISSECGKYWTSVRFLSSSCDRTWIHWISWSKFCPCTSVWWVWTAKTVVVALLSSSALIWHYTLFHLSSAPLFVGNTQTKALIIALIPSSETALYSQRSCPACCLCTAGPGHLKHTLFLLFPWPPSLIALWVCPWKYPSHSLPPNFCQSLTGLCHYFPSLFPLPFTSW